MTTGHAAGNEPAVVAPQGAGRLRSGRLLIKRAIDIAVAGLGLVLCAPVLALAAIAIRTTMGRGALFRHTRPGRHGEPFTLYKLRTMTDVADANGDRRPEYARVTPLGRFLRTASIDELPQLWNVLEGTMSLVGPRPLLTQYLPRYSAVQRRRHDVKPGITGWAQIHRRTAVTWEDRLELDVWYVDHWTLLRDLMILACTVRDIFFGGGNPAMDSLSRTTANELEFRGDSAEAGRRSRAMSSNVDYEMQDKS